jgi:hypothetical protein
LSRSHRSLPPSAPPHGGRRKQTSLWEPDRA